MLIEEMIRVVLVGVGATVLLDVWLGLLERLGVPTLDIALIGRWVGHAFRGTFVHPSIRGAVRIPGERALGWIMHYAVGIVFAALLFAVTGTAWSQNPSPRAAVIVGVLTVLFPLFVMQPAMGAGFAASKTPSPWKSCARSIASHAIFGVGLYVSAMALKRLMG
jgi:hypothetical protein